MPNNLKLKDLYDANGNMTQRPNQTLQYNPENQMTAVTGTPSAAFVYDGDGNRVLSTINGVTTAYIGNHTEWNVTAQEMTRYYLAGSQRVAFRVIKSGQPDKVYYLLADHLGSSNVVMQVGGGVENQTYTSWGELRTGGISSTKRQYTGQINESSLGLYFYNARWYDAALGRFISSDSFIPQPGRSQAWDRYSYVQNSPLKYTDPSGHRACNSFEDCEDYGVTPMGDDWADLYFSKLKYPYLNSPGNMSISKDGLDFIKSQEGLSLHLYNDGNQPDEPTFYNLTGEGQGNCTIGYGHLVHTGPCNGDSREVEFNQGVTIEQADTLLLADIVPAEGGVRKYVTVNLTQPQFDALVSLVFNWGINNFRSSPKLTMLNNGDYVDMALHLRKGPLGPNGKQYPGLVNRRESELAMFLTMVDR